MFAMARRLSPPRGSPIPPHPERTRSSAVEHLVDIEGVTGSIPVASTNGTNDSGFSIEFVVDSQACAAAKRQS